MFRFLLRLLSAFRLTSGSKASRIEDSFQEMTADELSELARLRHVEVPAWRNRFSPQTPCDDLDLLDCMIQDGSFFQCNQMQVLGVVWGDRLRATTELEWITAEWDGVRLWALRVPKTTVIVFPIAMLQKRRDRREQVSFRMFHEDTIAAIEKMKADPEYHRDR